MSQSTQKNTNCLDLKTRMALIAESGERASTRFGKSPKTRPNRRSLSGAPLTCLFETSKFQHLKVFQKAQNDARGLNSLLLPLSSGALYRSSMPATPIGTPSLFKQGIRFTEQALQERMKLRLQTDFQHSAYSPEPAINEVSESTLDLSSDPTNQTMDDRMSNSRRTRSRKTAENECNDQSSLEKGGSKTTSYSTSSSEVTPNASRNQPLVSDSSRSQRQRKGRDR